MRKLAAALVLAALVVPSYAHAAQCTLYPWLCPPTAVTTMTRALIPGGFTLGDAEHTGESGDVPGLAVQLSVPAPDRLVQITYTGDIDMDVVDRPSVVIVLVALHRVTIDPETKKTKATLLAQQTMIRTITTLGGAEVTPFTLAYVDTGLAGPRGYKVSMTVSSPAGGLLSLGDAQSLTSVVLP